MVEIGKAITYLSNVSERLMKYADFVPTYGLMDGKLGISIFLFTCTCITGDDKYGMYANDLLDDVFDNISFGDSLDFDTGLCGLSYGVKYLVKNEFIDPESIEVLTDLDNYISNIKDFRNIDEIMSVALYWKHRGRAYEYRESSTKLFNCIFEGINTKEFSIKDKSLIILELLSGHIIDKCLEESAAKHLYTFYMENISNLPQFSLSFQETYLREVISEHFGSSRTTNEDKVEFKLRDVISLQRHLIRWKLQMPSEARDKIEKVANDEDLLEEFIALSNPRTMNLSGNMLGFAWMLAGAVDNRFAL